MIYIYANSLILFTLVHAIISWNFTLIEKTGLVTKEKLLLTLKSQFPEAIFETTDNFDENGTTTLDYDDEERKRCIVKYGRKEYIAQYLATNPPPLLLSFPGSGNTWARLLIEIGTGINTGDIYTDHSLKSVFAGEKSCGKRVSVIKLHPQDMNITIPGQVYHTLPGIKCQRIGTTFFDRALIIHRNPFSAFWSEYQRGGKRDRHNKGIEEASFRWKLWREYSIDYANQFKDSWEVKYKHIFDTFPAKQFTIVSYERLVSENITEKELELEKIVEFLGFPIEKDRIKCAFLISFNKKVKRMITDKDITFEKAYSDPETLCPTLNIIHSMQSGIFDKFRLDYSPPTLPETLEGGVYVKKNPLTKCN